MSDNSSEGNESIEEVYRKEIEKEESNPLVKTMNEIESNNQTPSTIHKINQNSTKSSVEDVYNLLKDKRSPYQYKDKIPEIKIKDEYELENGEKIETYINCPFDPNFDDNIYNICEKCGENNNYSFCKKCSKNRCNICSEDCNKKHQYELIKLIPDEIKFYKEEIERIIKEYIIEPKKKEENGVKEQENKIIDEPIKKFENYSNDIILINLILDSNYNNYLHYKNIENCYKYMKRKYDINVKY